MSKLINNEKIVTTATAETKDENVDNKDAIKEKIASRRTIVYQTLIDPAELRIKGEKTKHKLFNNSIFERYNPSEIEFVSIEKYYEPFVVVNGKYSIDYYRQSVYALKLDKDVREVVLFDRTFVPGKAWNSSVYEYCIKIEGEERLFKERKAFLVLNKYGQDANINDFRSGPSEDNSLELVSSLKMQEIPSNLDTDVIRERIAQRPFDANRIVTETLEIDERSVIYAPRFKLTYKCLSNGKQACMEFDGVSSKRIKQKENAISAVFGDMGRELKRLVGL